MESILNIPEEIISEILLFLDPLSFKSINLTCSKLKNIINDTYFIRTWFNARLIPNKIWEKYKINEAITLKSNMELYFNRVVPENEFIKLCEAYNINKNECVFYINEYLNIHDCSDEQIMDIINIAYKVILGANDGSTTKFIEFLIYLIHLYFNKNILGKSSILKHITSFVNLIGDRGDKCILRFVKLYYKYLDWNCRSNSVLKANQGEFFTTNSYIMEFVGFDKLVTKIKFPQHILQEQLDKIQEPNKRTLLMNIVILQKVTEDFIHRNSKPYANDKELLLTISRYQGVVM